MKVDRLELKNFRSAKSITFEFSDKLNLFVGVNGVGKSTVLDALSTCLSWLIKRIERKKGRGQQISDASISIGADAGFLDIQLSCSDSLWRWSLAKTVKGKSSDYESRLAGVTSLAKKLKHSQEQTASWPVIAYYPVGRVVKDASPILSSQHPIKASDVYENALGGAVTYQSFFEWFRLQDDALNEKTASRINWIKQKRKWIENNIHRILETLNASFQNEVPAFRSEKFKREIIYHEPRFLFSELALAFETQGVLSGAYTNYEGVMEELKDALHGMNALGSVFSNDHVEGCNIPEAFIQNNFDLILRILGEKHSDRPLALFLWNACSFSLALSFWWISDAGMRDLEDAFRRMGAQIEDASNVAIAGDAFIVAFGKILLREADQHGSDHGFKFVAQAIEQFLPELTALRVERTPHPRMRINKKDEAFDLDQLSDGEKNTIALVGDVARRLALGNPQMANPIFGEGVILIDEVDLHLHPSWQRLIVPKLLEVFPNCQFFMSTHSPQILSHVKPEHVFLLEQTEDGLHFKKPSETYGMSLDRVVELVMDDESRPRSVRDGLEELFELIERKEFSIAKTKILSFKSDMPNDPEIMRAEMLIRQAELKG